MGKINGTLLGMFTKSNEIADPQLLSTLYSSYHILAPVKQLRMQTFKASVLPRKNAPTMQDLRMEIVQRRLGSAAS